MGSHAHLYIGPYVTGICVPTVEQVKVKGCPNLKCAHGKPKDQWGSIKTAFCPGCGTAIAEVEIAVMRRVSHYDVLPNERLFFIGASRGKAEEEQHVYFGSNIRNHGRGYSVDDEHHLNLAEVDVQTEIDEFSSLFSGEIEALRKAYKDVQVAWGVHYYWY